jgi:hypothetical protein
VKAAFWEHGREWSTILPVAAGRYRPASLARPHTPARLGFSFAAGGRLRPGPPPVLRRLSAQAKQRRGPAPGRRPSARSMERASRVPRGGWGKGAGGSVAASPRDGPARRGAPLQAPLPSRLRCSGRSRPDRSHQGGGVLPRPSVDRQIEKGAVGAVLPRPPWAHTTHGPTRMQWPWPGHCVHDGSPGPPPASACKRAARCDAANQRRARAGSAPALCRRRADIP